MISEHRPTIVVWFSCGAASAVAAKLTIERYGATHKIRIVNNVVAEEDADNRRFLDDVSGWLGHPIEIAGNPKYLDNSAASVWEHRKYMSGPTGAPCTIELKKVARQLWEKNNTSDFIVLGFTADEEARHKRFVLTERNNVLPVLINAGMTKQDCFDRLVAEGLRLPNSYAQGYPNANCKGCVKATSATYWSLVREKDPDVYAARAEQSRRLGARLVRYQGKRLFLDELPVGAKGRPMKKLAMPDCGIFCEEKSVV